MSGTQQGCTMRIEALLSAYSPDAMRPGESRASRGRSAQASGSAHKNDRIEISDEARKRLDRVRQRIQNGFYDKDAVADDISDKLSGVIESLR